MEESSNKFSVLSKDTILLTILSLMLQALGIVFNMKISEISGNAAVGIMSLIFSFFGYIMTLANGNIFVITGRFVSEEKEGKGNIQVIMKYSIMFCIAVSSVFSFLSFILSDKISENITDEINLSSAVKILSLSLIPAALGSCIKGYFHGLRKISVPMKGDTIEFLFKWLSMGIFLFTGFIFDFYIITVISVLIGEVTSGIYYLTKFISSLNFGYLSSGSPLIKSNKIFLKKIFPIVISGYVQMSLSAANELIVPIMLLKCSGSKETALSEYGMFEAMIIPTIFFPCTVMTSMSNIMLPETAAAMKKSTKKASVLTDNAFKKAFSYSFFIAGIFLAYGENIGNIICKTDSLVGISLKILSPVIPFIYLEIILEGILKGMDKQNFCTINSIIEYTIRIACVLIFVPIYGFYGVIISYYSSNCISNIMRIYVVCKTASLDFSFFSYILFPVIKSSFCIFVSLIVTSPLKSGSVTELIVKIAVCAFMYLLVGNICFDKTPICRQNHKIQLSSRELSKRVR